MTLLPLYETLTFEVTFYACILSVAGILSEPHVTDYIVILGTDAGV